MVESDGDYRFDDGEFIERGEGEEVRRWLAVCVAVRTEDGERTPDQ